MNTVNQIIIFEYKQNFSQPRDQTNVTFNKAGQVLIFMKIPQNVTLITLKLYWKKLNEKWSLLRQ